MLNDQYQRENERCPESNGGWYCPNPCPGCWMRIVRGITATAKRVLSVGSWLDEMTPACAWQSMAAMHCCVWALHCVRRHATDSMRYPGHGTRGICGRHRCVLSRISKEQGRQTYPVAHIAAHNSSILVNYAMDQLASTKELPLYRVLKTADRGYSGKNDPHSSRTTILIDCQPD